MILAFCDWGFPYLIERARKCLGSICDPLKWTGGRKGFKLFFLYRTFEPRSSQSPLRKPLNLCVLRALSGKNGTMYGSKFILIDSLVLEDGQGFLG